MVSLCIYVPYILVTKTSLSDHSLSKLANKKRTIRKKSFRKMKDVTSLHSQLLGMFIKGAKLIFL